MSTDTLISKHESSGISIAIATAILSATIGYFVGTASSLGIFDRRENGSSKHSRPKRSWPNSYDVKIHPDSSDDELMTRLRRDSEREVKDSEDEDDRDDQTECDSDNDGPIENELNLFESSREECKLVLVVRTDLGMTKGKIAAQASHATLACYKALKAVRGPRLRQGLLQRWQQQGQAKIALQAHSEDELLVLQAQAISLGLCAKIIHDAGRTQIASGTATVLGIGPGPRSVIDQVTGNLRLL